MLFSKFVNNLEKSERRPGAYVKMVTTRKKCSINVMQMQFLPKIQRGRNNYVEYRTIWGLIYIYRRNQETIGNHTASFTDAVAPALESYKATET